MRWIKKHSHLLISIFGYVLFFCAAVFSFRWFVNDTIGMDSLIAFLVSQALGMFVLHFMRRANSAVLQQRLSSHQYGVFLLVNAVVVLFNALTMYVLDLMSNYNESNLQVFATSILLCVNGIMQLMHENQLAMEEDQEQ